MFDKLKLTEKRFEEINEKLMDPNVVNDTNQYRDLMKEFKTLTPIIEKYREYLSAKKTFDESKELLDGGGLDKDFREMVQGEYDSSKEDIARITEELKILLLPKDPNDDRNVIIEIRGGVGGEEAALFAHSLFRMYSMYAENKRWKMDVMTLNETELGGIKEVCFSIEGEGAYSRLKYESGTHRVQRVPETESQGRVHTSAATVAVLPEADEVEVEINPADLSFDTFRASGAGGQHINKTESAVRIIHNPSGVVVECQEERSQRENKEKAMKMLRTKLYEMALKEKTDKEVAARRSQIGSGDRSERIRTYNYPEGRITDHRIGLTLYRLEYFLDGNIDDVIDALATADQAAKLSAQEEQ